MLLEALRAAFLRRGYPRGVRRTEPQDLAGHQRHHPLPEPPSHRGKSAISTPRPGRILWNPDRAKLQCLLDRCCMPVDEYELALGSTLGSVIFAAHLSSWYAEGMLYALSGPSVPTCRDCLADGDRRSPGWLPFHPWPGKSGNFPSQVPDFPRSILRGREGVRVLAAASGVSTALVRAHNVCAMFGHVLMISVID